MYTFQPISSNRKVGPMPTVYAHRSTCPPTCPHKDEDCYAEDFYTRLAWKRTEKGMNIDTLARCIEALRPGTVWRYGIAGDLPGKGSAIDAVSLGKIVHANRGKRGFAYSHKRTATAIKWMLEAVRWGFTINLSADDAGEADRLRATGLPVVCIVPRDTPEHSTTPDGHPIVVCPNQTRNMQCTDCQLCARPNRRVIVGFRAHGTRAAQTEARARRVIPIVQA